MWGGYPPKQYDGDFLREHKKEIRLAFAGATVIADNHFSVGKTIFDNVTFLTNYPESSVGNKRKADDLDEEDVGDGLTKEKRSFNNDHRHARARVESPFGWMKRKFGALAEPWAEGNQDQLDYLVWIAAALYTLLV